jgi:hypothetical protein
MKYKYKFQKIFKNSCAAAVTSYTFPKIAAARCTYLCICNYDLHLPVHVKSATNKIFATSAYEELIADSIVVLAARGKKSPTAN